MQFVLAAILPVGKDQQPFTRRQGPLREDPAGLGEGIAQLPAAQLHQTVGAVFQLQPVGEIPVLIPQHGLVFGHELRDAHRAVLSRGRPGRKQKRSRQHKREAAEEISEKREKFRHDDSHGVGPK